MAKIFDASFIGLIFLITAGMYLLYIFYYAIDIYILAPKRNNRPLTQQQERLIAANLPAYGLLNLAHKEKFKKRFAKFNGNKEFVFSVNSAKNDDIRVLLNATSTFLTLGLRDYRLTSVERILIYPSQYFSRITKRNHYGEYNPKLKLLVFSAEHILKGFDDATDNLNLGVHEFAHALVFNFRQNYSFTGITFNRGLSRLSVLLADPLFLQKLKNTTYFREYGKTSIHEFFAVALENYVETPSDFVAEFPELYKIITKMLNFKAFDFHK